MTEGNRNEMASVAARQETFAPELDDDSDFEWPQQPDDPDVDKIRENEDRWKKEININRCTGLERIRRKCAF